MTDETTNQNQQPDNGAGSAPAPQVRQPEQEQTEAQGQEQQTGSSSLNTNRKNDQKGAKALFFAGVIILALLVLCIFLKPWQWFGSDDSSETKQDEKTDQGMTSQVELRQGEIPVDQSEKPIDDDEEPDLEAKKDDGNLGLVPGAPAPAAGSVQAQAAPASTGPTLEDLKFQAPMMGGGSTGSSGSTYARTDTASGTGTEQQKYPTYDEILEEQRRKMGVSANGQGSAAGNFPGAGRPGGQSLESKLQGTPTPVGDTVVNHNRSLMISKGTVIDCILETRLDTTVPGFTSCVIPRDIYSQDGKVLLVERGTKAVGEYQGGVANGLARIFVLWTELRTPEGVIVSVASPAADSLGGAGMGGYVDFHWWKRFGNALLFSMVSSAFDFATAKEAENNGDFQMNDSGMQEIIQEAMRQAGNIPPTLYKNQGEHVAIFVARDIDFSNSYQLSVHH